MTFKHWLILLLLAFIWGSSFPLIKLSLISFPPFTLVFIRVSIAALSMYIIMKYKRLSLIYSYKIWGMAFIMGLFNNMIPFSLISWGQLHIDAGLASIFNATTPLFAIVLAHYFTRDEPITFRRISGVFIGFFGVIILIGLNILQQISISNIAQIAIILGAASYAIAGIYGKRFHNIPIPITITMVLTASSIEMLPLAIIYESHHWLVPDLYHVFAIIILGVICTGLAYMIYFYLLYNVGVTNVLLVTFFVPITAIFLSVLFLEEKFKFQNILGMLVIFIGLYISHGKWKGR